MIQDRSGLDADLLDGLDSAALDGASENVTIERIHVVGKATRSSRRARPQQSP